MYYIHTRELTTINILLVHIYFWAHVKIFCLAYNLNALLVGMHIFDMYEFYAKA